MVYVATHNGSLLRSVAVWAVAGGRGSCVTPPSCRRRPGAWTVAYLYYRAISRGQRNNCLHSRMLRNVSARFTWGCGAVQGNLAKSWRGRDFRKVLQVWPSWPSWKNSNGYTTAKRAHGAEPWKNIRLTRSFRSAGGARRACRPLRLRRGGDLPGHPGDAGKIRTRVRPPSRTSGCCFRCLVRKWRPPCTAPCAVFMVLGVTE